MIFTGKYGNMNFKMKVTHYPTLPCEYHKSTSPNIYLEEGHACKEQRLMTPRPTNLYYTHSRLNQMMPGRGSVACHSSLSVKNIGLITSLARADARNCHRSSRL